MKLVALFKAAVASVTIAGAGAAGGYAGYTAAPRLYNHLTETPTPSTSTLQDDTLEAYQTRLDTLIDRQNGVEYSTDQEEETLALDESKKEFATDAALDPNLSEADFGVIAARFNPLSKVDTIRLRSYNFDERTISRRDECLAATPATNEQWGADRYAYAQRVETCMIEKLQHTGDGAAIAQKMGAAGGALGGAGLAFGFSLGYAVRSNRRPKAAKPA